MEKKKKEVDYHDIDTVVLKGKQETNGLSYLFLIDFTT